MICCRKCGYVGKNETGLHLHHLIPKSIGGTDLDGRVYLCHKCHNILHNMIPKFVFNHVPENFRDFCMRDIKRKSEWFINKK